MGSVDASDYTIVIPQHNEATLTVECVRSFRAAEQPSGRVLIVDDGSRPSELGMTQRALSSECILRQRHQGVSAAWNLGARTCASQYLVFLNNDVVSRGPWVEELLMPLRRGEVVMTGAGCRRETAVGRELLSQLRTACFLEGWCLALSAALLQQIGGFDESLRLYFSDTDVQLRLLESAGLDGDALRVVSGLPLSHTGHCSTRRVPNRQEVWMRDRERFVQKWTKRTAESQRRGER